MTVDLKGRLRAKGVRFVPNTREQAQAFNRKMQPDTIPEHNDINKIEWTDVVGTADGSSPDCFVGHAALRISDQSKPRYKLCWPLRYGTFNERDYSDQNHLYRDIITIIEEAIKGQLGLRSARERAQYSCVLVIPDLYEKKYVITMLELLFRDFGFTKVSLIQESMSASFGAGFSTCCVVDVGAYKTSICCVDEGLVVENSRITMRYGSADVTEAFVKMLLSSSFPYADLNLRRRFDFLLAEELKQRFGTLAYSDLAHGSQQHDFHLRAPDQETRHYRFKCYDEVMLSTMVSHEESCHMDRGADTMSRAITDQDCSILRTKSLAEEVSLDARTTSTTVLQMTHFLQHKLNCSISWPPLIHLLLKSRMRMAQLQCHQL